MFRYILRFIFRIRYWLVVIPIISAAIAFFATYDMERSYNVETSLYTGVISGQNTLLDDASSSTVNVQNALMENMINVITSSGTLKRVSLTLFAQSMIYGDPAKDTKYVNAATYRKLQEITPKEVKDLIVKDSIEKTVENLKEYEKVDPKNFVFGLFNWSDPHFSYNALSRIKAKRVGGSDILDITYSCDDPGIAYNTLLILTKTFISQYEAVRFGGSNDVISFFRGEMKRIGDQLHHLEDSLTAYNVQNKVINYGEQTKQIAAMSRDFTLENEGNLRNFYSSKALVKVLEDRIGNNAKLLKNNTEFVNRMRSISDLTFRISQIQTLYGDSLPSSKKMLDAYRKQLKDAQDELGTFSQSFYDQKYSKEGYPNQEVVSQWLAELLKLEQATAQQDALNQWHERLDEEYSFYSPIGVTIKRIEREIDFLEASYLAILHNLNEALLKQKNQQMMTATIKIVNQPIYPLEPVPTKRKMIILAAFFSSFILVLSYFILLEFFDQTLKDKTRAERIIGGKVIGAYPLFNSKKGIEFDEERGAIASKYLSNALTTYFVKDLPQVINLLSPEVGEGKSLIANHLSSSWTNQGFKVRYINWETDFSAHSREFLLSKSIQDTFPSEGEDILIIEYPFLRDNSIPPVLLKSTINLFILNATRSWKETDDVIYEKLSSLTGETPLFIYLNKAEEYAVEVFTGLLPPYTRFRKIFYRMLQLGFTSSEKETH